MGKRLRKSRTRIARSDFSVAFWDTSALLKLYVRERDSDRFAELIRTSIDRTVISQLTLAEMHRALWGKALARAIPAKLADTTYREFRSDIEAVALTVLPLGREVEHEFDRIVPLCYRANPAVPIRTLDGLVLASAVVARTPELVSTDSRMRRAAVLLGLRILPE
ncbi:MAG TPA: type II toxin-antitoxin system VapC family toxin [Chthoniobacterales bacterium]|nr:type II toxin-antitoxin system VapC family toxin [Chthoniobacterales bacterium]